MYIVSHNSFEIDVKVGRSDNVVFVDNRYISGRFARYINNGGVDKFQRLVDNRLNILILW